jgi:beta-N-acetylhexosaminidase
VIRRDLDFKGVIITDDITMEAISDFAGDQNAAVLAVKGGNDMICCTDFSGGCKAVVEAVNNGEIPVEQIDQSVMRILKWKQNLGILGY